MILSWTFRNELAAKTKCYFAFRTIVLTTLLLMCAGVAHAKLVPVVQVTGKISVSADGQGNNNPDGGVLRISKPTGATVRGAFLMAASNFSRTIADGDVILNGNPVKWNKAVFSNAGSFANFFHNVFADVTGMLKPVIDISGDGLLTVTVKEVGTTTIDGTILVVIFDDPSQTTDRSVLLMFGGQDTRGDAFTVTLSRPLGTTAPAVATMGLGISFGFQGSTGTDMESEVDVNGLRLTSSAGGEDDGAPANGALITVGGIGDSIANPSPFAPSTGLRTDDELYDLSPFVASGTKSIAIHTLNPSNDDNILFAYFITSEPAAIVPQVPPPGARTVIGTIDPSLPTIVLTHGLQKQGTDVSTLWTGTSTRQASSLISNALGTQHANIVQYVWEEGFQPFGCFIGLPDDDAYKAAQQNVVDAGLRLASELQRALGPGYNKPIHFIGHSLGTAVNTYAATALVDQLPSITTVQFTALDRPHHVTKICQMSDSEEKIYGFNSDFFAMNLPISHHGLSLKIDNYYSLDGAGVGDVANGPVYNHPALVDSNRLDDPIFGDEGFDNSHSGVQQWYRWTISPTDPFPQGQTVCSGATFTRPPSGIGEALNPCQRGWYWSLLNKPSAFPSNNGSPINRTTAVLLRLFDPREFGCTVTSTSTSNRIDCKEASSPFSIATIDIPEDAKFLSFNYTFANAGDGDYAVVFIDGAPIWKLAGSSAFIGTSMDSGAIPIEGLSGRHDLMIALFGVGEKNFAFTMNDFRVFGVTANNPPVANAGANQTLECTANGGTSVVLDGSASFDPDGDPLSYQWTDSVGQVIGNTAVVNLSVALGIQTFTLTVEDRKGGTSSADVTIKVQDTIPPVLTFALSPSILWPPDHKLNAVTASVQVNDVCDPHPRIALTSISSNEPDIGLGDGDTARDIQNALFGTDDRLFLLRAERAGGGTGRIYTVIYEASDASNNATFATSKVSVPHDQAKQ